MPSSHTRIKNITTFTTSIHPYIYTSIHPLHQISLTHIQRMCIVWGMCHFVKKLSIWLATKCSLWKLKHDETGWHSQVREGDGEEFAIPGWDELEKLQQESHEAYILNQKIC